MRDHGSASSAISAVTGSLAATRFMTMKTTRREFLGAVAASPLLLGMQDKAGSKAPVMGAAPTPMRRPTTGACCRRRSSGATPTASSRTRRATSTSTTRCTRRATAPTRWSSSIARASSCARGARSIRGVAHGLWIRKEGRDEFLYLTVNAANPKMSPQPEHAGGASSRRR